MQLLDGEIKATGTNFSGYTLFLVAATLEIDAGAPVGDGRILCTVATRQRTEIAQTSGGLRATFPRSSEAGIYSQDVPETLLIDFSARGGELVILEPELSESFTTERGIKLEWPKYEVGTEHLKYFIAGGKPEQDLVLPFYTVWKTTSVAGGRSFLHPHHERRQRRPPAPPGSCQPSRRRSTKRPKRKTKNGQKKKPRNLKRKAEAQPAAGRRAAPAPRSPCRPCSASGSPERSPSAPASSGPHIATASSALELGVEPGGLRLGAGEDHRHPVVDAGDDARSASS